MFTLALLPSDFESRGIYLCSRQLPANYMGDFSLMGFVVDNYPDALKLLISSGYQVDELDGGADISIDTPESIPEIAAFLAANHIRSDLTDIADTIYQA